MTVKSPIRVLVVASTWWWREALLRVLERSGARFDPRAAGGLTAARRRMAEHEVAIVDLDDGDGLVTLADARERNLATIALSSSATLEQVNAALSLGASYVVKSELDPDRLRHLVAMSASGDALLVRASNRFLSNLAVGPPRERYNLTPREAEVLTHLARGRTNAEIAAAMHLAPSSVKKLVSRCLTRLGVRNRVEAALVARREGLVAPSEALVRGTDVQGC